MKFLLFLLPLSIDAFTAPTYHFRRVESRLFAERPDASELIQQAMAAAKEFGATSKEARLAWEAVEELSASTRTSDALALGEDLEECDVEATSAECIEYGAKLDALATLIAETTPQVNRVKNLAAEIKAIKLTPVAMMPTGADSPALRAALAAAKAATAEFGPTSSQAALAWEELEEIASATEISGALGGVLTDECLTDMVEACEALEELDRVLDLK